MSKEKGVAIREVVHDQAFEKQLARLAGERDERERFNKNGKGPWAKTKERMKMNAE